MIPHKTYRENPCSIQRETAAGRANSHRMRRLPLLCTVLALVAGSTPAWSAPGDKPGSRAGSVYAEVTDTEVVLGNSVAERRWSRDGLRTTSLVDKRGQDRQWSTGSRDFSLTLAATTVGSELLTVEDVTTTELDRGGLQLRMELTGLPGVAVTRVVEAYNGIAGFRTQTLLTPTAPLPLRGGTLDEAAVGTATPVLHAFRAGADWREPDYTGPEIAVGDKHPGTWRDTRTAAAGEPLQGPGQWLSMSREDGRTAFLVAERNDLPSSRAAYDGSSASLVVDYSRDVISLGPIEEQAHAENPTAAPARHRVLPAGETFAFDAAFLGFGQDRDSDEPWQFAKFLRDHRLAPYAKDVTFNSNGTDDDVISTGAKDDMDYATVLATAPKAKAMGIDTFILDDGWQATSGDWEPDSPQHPEPRWDGNPTSKYKPRFPDDSFAAVREAIAPMKLGLWMSPMHFNPASETAKANPDWVCTPIGQGTTAVNLLQPDSSSNEAGIGIWGPKAIPHIESRIREAITEWQVTYFKFDFLMWVDCAGQGTLQDYQDAFVGMLDRLKADFPEVTFQIDETNDYRLFPFASVSRGPSWFQNGTPAPDRLMHNLWNLAPWIPTESLGQHFLGGKQYERFPVDTLMAIALLSHPTVFSDLRGIPDDVVAAAAPWTRFYAQHRDLLTEGVTYPLLADPLEKSWTGLQTWDADRARGAVVVLRQSATTSSTPVPLRGIPDGKVFDLYEAPSGELVGSATSEELQRGLNVELPAADTAKVLVVRSRS